MIIILNKTTLEPIGPFESMEDAKTYLLKKYKKVVFNVTDISENATVIEEFYKKTTGFELPSYKETERFIIRNITSP